MKIGIISEPGYVKDHVRALESDGHRVLLLGGGESSLTIPASLDVLICRHRSCSHYGFDVAMATARERKIPVVFQDSVTGMRSGIRQIGESTSTGEPMLKDVRTLLDSIGFVYSTLPHDHPPQAAFDFAKAYLGWDGTGPPDAWEAYTRLRIGHRSTVGRGVQEAIGAGFTMLSLSKLVNGRKSAPTLVVTRNELANEQIRALCTFGGFVSDLPELAPVLPVTPVALNEHTEIRGSHSYASWSETLGKWRVIPMLKNMAPVEASTRSDAELAVLQMDEKAEVLSRPVRPAPVVAPPAPIVVPPPAPIVGMRAASEALGTSRYRVEALINTMLGLNPALVPKRTHDGPLAYYWSDLPALQAWHAAARGAVAATAAPVPVAPVPAKSPVEYTVIHALLVGGEAHARRVVTAAIAEARRHNLWADDINTARRLSDAHFAGKVGLRRVALRRDRASKELFIGRSRFNNLVKRRLSSPHPVEVEWFDWLTVEEYVGSHKPRGGSTQVEPVVSLGEPTSVQDVLDAVAEGGWASGQGTGDPEHRGPTLKDAAAVIREYLRFREEVWNADAEKEAREAVALPDDLTDLLDRVFVLVGKHGIPQHSRLVISLKDVHLQDGSSSAACHSNGAFAFDGGPTTTSLASVTCPNCKSTSFYHVASWVLSNLQVGGAS